MTFLREKKQFTRKGKVVHYEKKTTSFDVTMLIFRSSSSTVNVSSWSLPSNQMLESKMWDTALPWDCQRIETKDHTFLLFAFYANVASNFSSHISFSSFVPNLHFKALVIFSSISCYQTWVEAKAKNWNTSLRGAMFDPKQKSKKDSRIETP